MKIYRFAFCLSTLLIALPVAASPTVRTLAEAISLTKQNHPRLLALKHQQLSAVGLRNQAAAFPNPEFDVEVEEFGGSRDGFHESETTLSFNQPLELGGKRQARISVAERKEELTRLETVIEEQEILSSVEVAFAQLQLAQATRDVHREQEQAFSRAVSIATKKLEAGAIRSFDRTNTVLAWRDSQSKLIASEQLLSEAKRALALLWEGDPTEIRDVALASLSPEAATLMEKDLREDSLYLHHAAVSEKLKENELRLQKSLAVPDLSIGAGYKRYEDSNEDTFLGSLSIEIPLFNRNQGAISHAKQELKVQSFNSKNQAALLHAQFKTAREELRRLLEQHTQLLSLILPNTAKLKRETEEAYKQGRSSYFELHHALRSIFEANLQREELLFKISKSVSLLKKLSRSTPTKKAQIIKGEG